MSNRLRQIYNIWGLYAGPNIATGYTYADYNGERHNDSQLTIFDTNLLKPLDRINSCSYSFNIERVNLSHLGVRGLIDRIIVKPPTVQLNMNYWLAGVRNEDKLGFVVNYPDITGTPIYNTEQCFIRNFTGWETDCRNIFVAISPNNLDLNNRISDVNYPNQDIHPSGLFCIGFGNAYINNYSVHAAVGELPSASVGYICDNIVAYASGSGCNIPAISPKSGNLINGPTFTIPRNNSNYSTSVLLPGNITVQIGDIYETNNYPIYNYFYLFNIQTNLYNKIQVSGSNGNETLLIQNGEIIPDAYNLSGAYIKNIDTNLYNQIYTSGSDGSQVIIGYTGINNVTGYDLLYLKNISTNNYTQLLSSGNDNNHHLNLMNFNMTTVDNSILFGMKTEQLAIQSLDWSINIDREALRSIGYAYPIDRRTNFPIFGNLSFNSIISDNQTGDLSRLFTRDKNYDIIINMYNNSCNESGRQLTIQQKFKGVKFVGASYNYNLTNKLLGNYNFELDVDLSRQKSIYISGLYNEEFPQFPYNYLVLEQNKSGFLFLDNNDLLIL